MVLIHKPSRYPFGSILTRREGLQGGHETGAIYVGLGDRFDDDRRLVRETALTLSSTLRGGRTTTSTAFGRR